MSPRTAAATEAVELYAAQRAATIPTKRNKALRIVGASLVAGTITPDDILAHAERIAATAGTPEEIAATAGVPSPAEIELLRARLGGAAA